jgi:hypothetical protein
MTTLHELRVVDFFLVRIAVASPQWENGLGTHTLRTGTLYFYLKTETNPALETSHIFFIVM